MDFRAMPVQRHGLPQPRTPGSFEITNPFADLATVNPCDGLVSQTFVKEVVRKNCGKVTVRLTLPEIMCVPSSKLSDEDSKSNRCAATPKFFGEVVTLLLSPTIQTLTPRAGLWITSEKRSDDQRNTPGVSGRSHPSSTRNQRAADLQFARFRPST